MSTEKRFYNALRNSSVAFGGQIINIVLGFVIRSMFIYKLGKEYLGVNGVMESMLTLLSMTELGIGTSVAFALYQPVHEKDEQKIGTLMAFYRRTYQAIGMFTLVLGLLLIPFMRFFTKDATQVQHITLIYLIFLATTALSYFFSYRYTLLSAYQENYITTLSDDIFCFIKYLLQATVLLIFQSYIGYLLVHMVCVLSSNFVISFIVKKRYPFLKMYQKNTLAKKDKALLKTSVVSLLYQKIGAKLVMGTDNLMISYVSIAAMGLYANYVMVTNTIARVIYNVTRSVTGSVGNLLVQKDHNHKYRVFEEIVFVEFCFYSVVSAELFSCLERFIALWAGTDWLLPTPVAAVVVLNFYLMGMRQPNVLVIDTAGLFNKMRAKAVAEVFVNLIVSFLFLIVLNMGIYGVLLGTTVSMVSVCIWWEIKAVHKYAFFKSPLTHVKNYLQYLLVTMLSCGLSFIVGRALPYGGLLGLVLSGVCALFVSVSFILLFFGRTAAFRHFVKRIIKK